MNAICHRAAAQSRDLAFRARRGFTLVELLITVAIVALLAAIAFPAYDDYVVRGKLVEGINGVMSLRVKLERYYQDYQSYGMPGGACGLPAATMPTSQYFTFTCTVGATNQQYLVRASSRANAGLGAAGAYQYTVDDNDQRATPFFRGTADTATCWLRKRGDTC